MRRPIPGGEAIPRLHVSYAAHLPAYAPADIPTDEPDGTLVFDDQRKIPAWVEGGATEWPTFVDNDDVATSAQTVANTTDETEVLRIGVDPDSMVQGRLMILRVFGQYSTASATDSFTYRLKAGDAGFDAVTGGTTIASAVTVPETVTDGPFQVKTTMSVWEDSATGQMDFHTEASFNDTKSDHSHGTEVVDTTTAEEFAVTFEWNAANVDNHATRRQAYLQQQA